jgi:hypothetical protein
MKSSILAIASLLLAIANPSIAQETESLSDHAVTMCAVSSSDKSPASVDVMKARAGDQFSNVGPICAIYITAWKAGFDNAFSGNDDTCAYLTKKVDGGESDAYTTFANQNNLSEIDKVKLFTRCDTYKNGYTAGLKRARDIMTR